VNFVLFFVVSCGSLAGALVAPRGTPSAPRAALALALSIGGVFSPLFLTREWPILRTVTAFAVVASLYRVIAIVRRPDSPVLGRVLAAALPVVDARRVARVPRAFLPDAFVVGAFNCLLAYALFRCAALVPPAAPYSGMTSALRTLVGGASAYFLVDGTARLLTAVSSALGLDIGPLHDAPILARSVGEFWGRRWNRSVHRWLDDNAFRPVAKRFGLGAGVMAAFVASAVLHLVPIWTAYSGRAAAQMGAFFCLHGAIVILESRLRVARWPRALGHVWTLGLFAATAPLFVEPLLESMGA
jgi:hypothetical protein